MRMLLIFLLCCSFFITGCDEEEAIPAYLEIAPFTLTTNGVQGSASEKITEVWVTVNGEFLGAYDLPAVVPVLAAGSAQIRLDAGIKDNGISDFPEIYPFYAPYEATVSLTPGQRTAVAPRIGYLPNARFGFIEDFEDNRPRIFTQVLAGNSAITRTTTDVFEGQYAGELLLNKDDAIVVELASGNNFSGLTEAGVYVYLEVNYKSDAPVFWGIVGETDPVTGLEKYYEPGFAPKDEWNKIYFNLSQQIFSSGLANYQFALQAIMPSDGPETARVLLDNIKLVHF